MITHQIGQPIIVGQSKELGEVQVLGHLAILGAAHPAPLLKYVPPDRLPEAFDRRAPKALQTER